MDCIVHGVTKSRTQLGNSHLQKAVTSKLMLNKFKDYENLPALVTKGWMLQNSNSSLHLNTILLILL